MMIGTGGVRCLVADSMRPPSCCVVKNADWKYTKSARKFRQSRCFQSSDFYDIDILTPICIWSERWLEAQQLLISINSLANCIIPRELSVGQFHAWRSFPSPIYEAAETEVSTGSGLPGSFTVIVAPVAIEAIVFDLIAMEPAEAESPVDGFENDEEAAVENDALASVESAAEFAAAARSDYLGPLLLVIALVGLGLAAPRPLDLMIFIMFSLKLLLSNSGLPLQDFSVGKT